MSNVITNKKDIEYLIRKYIKDLIWSVTKIEIPNITFIDAETVIDDLGYSTLKYEQQSIINGIKWSFQTLLEQNRKFDSIFVKDIAYAILCSSETHYRNAGKIRANNVKITGVNYIPKPVTIEDLEQLISEVNNISKTDPKLAAATWLAKASKRQFFEDGNKRTALVSANKILLDCKVRILLIDATDTKLHQIYRKNLSEYYENEDKLNDLSEFIINNCIKNTYDLQYIDVK